MPLAYCIRRAGDPAPDGIAGPGGDAVRAVEEGGLGIWLSEGEPAGPDPARLRAYDAVVRAALRTATPLPLRYGTAFRDEEAAREALRARREEWLAALERVASRVEMGVQLIGEVGAELDAAPNPVIRSGRDFLEARKRELGRGEARRVESEAALDRVAAHFAALGLPTARVVAPAPGVVGSLAHLVHRSDLDRYRSAANAALIASSPLRLRLSGPWAPYSFV